MTDTRSVVLDNTILVNFAQAGCTFPNRRDQLFEIASSGTLEGLSVLDPGLGLDVVPYAVAEGRRDRRTGEETSDFEPGLDLRYRLTTSLSATFTVNTDFAQTEVDDRVVSLSRFPVFFPEKRDFFLEDSGIFVFGPFGRRRNQLLPFFSRRIGLSADGEAVPILVGAKLTGRQGRFNLGLLDVVTDDFAGVGKKNLVAGRVSANLGTESQAGVIFTAGDPATEGDNALAGLDLTWRTSRLRGDRNFRLDLFALATTDEPEADASEDAGEEIGGHAFGFLAQYPNDRIEAEIGYMEVSEDFAPDLGFVRRKGVRRFHGELEWRPRPASGPIRRYAFQLQPEIYTRLGDGNVESAELRASAEALFHVTDSLGINSRLRWILEPGRDLFFVLDHSLEDRESGGLQAAESALTLKSLYTFRF